MTTTSLVYVIGPVEQAGPVKIGYTSSNPRSRLYALNIGSPVRLRLMWTGEGGRDAEQFLHRAFAQQRERGEWFNLGDDPVARVAAAFEAYQSPAAMRAAQRQRDAELRWQLVWSGGEDGGVRVPCLQGSDRRCRCLDAGGHFVHGAGQPVEGVFLTSYPDPNVHVGLIYEDEHPIYGKRVWNPPLDVDVADRLGPASISGC